ncbi:metal-dependent transcriptional regulator [Rarobacter incanus]|nr:metal-dependent transcriptional regulator [Rarobacter incanus]
MSVSELSASTQNYLKVVWGLGEWSQDPITARRIAARMGLRLSTVSEAVSKLSAQGLLDHTPYGDVQLTDRGRGFALQMVRRHRLIESFLVETLGYTWDQVHDEAESLEHAVSDFMIERVDDLLGHPRRDPHGDPIPTAAGDIEMPRAQRLSDLTPPLRVVIERISDEDPALLQHFSDNGMVIGTLLRIEPGAPFTDSVMVHVGDAEAVALGATATDALYVSEAK